MRRCHRLRHRRALPPTSQPCGRVDAVHESASGARITLDGMPSHLCLDAREGAPLVENHARDAGELVGQRNAEHIVVQSLLRCLDPGLEPVPFPMLGPELDQNDPAVCRRSMSSPQGVSGNALSSFRAVPKVPS
jgi:hypothetical protein